jgi:WD40 repeat protein
VRFIDEHTLVVVRETEDEASGTEALFWDLAVDQPLRRVELQYEFLFPKLLVSADGRWLAASPYREEFERPRVDVWNLERGELVWSLELESRPLQLAISADGRSLAFWTDDDPDVVQIWDVESQLIKTTVSRGLFDDFVLSPRGKYLAVGGLGGVAVVDLETEKQTWTSNVSESLSPIEFSLDGSSLLTVGGDMSLRVWDAASGKPVGRPATKLHLPSLSPDGRVLAMYREPTITLWDSTTGRKVALPDITHSPLPSPYVFAVGLFFWILCWVTVSYRRKRRFRGDSETGIAQLTQPPDVILAETVDESDPGSSTEERE